MRIVRKLTDNKFLNIKEVVDISKHVQGFQFAERLGVDSVAFVCYDRNKELFLLNNEYKPPNDLFLSGAFGGSIDKNKKKEEIVIDECKEEAGFTVSFDNVKYVGKVMVSTQMNQFCYLYLVEVNKEDQGEKMPENEVEAMSTTSWLPIKDIFKLNDWKCITIIAKAKGLDIL